MQTLVQKISSRKFLFTLGAVLVALGLFLQGQLDAVGLVTTLTTLVVGYNVAEATVDAARERDAYTAFEPN